MSKSIELLTAEAKALRDKADAAIKHADAMDRQSKESRAQAASASAEAEKIEADIRLLENGGNAPAPKVFAGRNKISIKD